VTHQGTTIGPADVHWTEIQGRKDF
jgi:hypothetical protein